MKNVFLIFTLLLGFNGYSTLSADSLKLSVLKQLGIKETELKEELWAEKVLPYAKTQTVMVVPHLIDENEIEGMFTLDAVIVVVNNQTGKIIQQYKEENLIFSDAVFISEFIIDTAPYMLTKQIRAFGIRAQFYGSSHANPYSEVQLSLFVQEGNSLRQVLKEEVIEQSSGEWNTDCNGRFHDMKSIILFETETSKSYFNLVIKKRSSIKLNEKIKGECEERITDKQEKKKVLHYDGKSYK
ncbi:hypothetical protein [Fluviicola taffensis]|uniref:hypothetical protein n=1 Tax=Fluviicola taffensis TaxID=191579 RepID=UPI003137BEE8